MVFFVVTKGLQQPGVVTLCPSCTPSYLFFFIRAYGVAGGYAGLHLGLFIKWSISHRRLMHMPRNGPGWLLGGRGHKYDFYDFGPGFRKMEIWPQRAGKWYFEKKYF